MATRIVFHTILTPTGEPWPGFHVSFQLTPTDITPHATLPEHSVQVVSDAAGYFEATLETGVRYTVHLISNVQHDRRNIVIPHGASPISLPTVLALNTEPDGDPDLITLANDHIGRRDNPHEVTAEQVGAYTTGEVDGLIAGVESGASGALLAHTSNTANPHAVTATQVGLGNVANLAPADLPVSTAQGAAITAVADDLDAHEVRTDNPHAVTADQVGLGNVVNVAQAPATRTISAGTGLTGGGDLTADRTLALDAGSIASLALADTSMQAADIADFETTAELNARDTANRSRANHTGTQAAATISDLAATVTAHADVSANTAARHVHANKATLDGIGSANLVPTPGIRGQVLTVGPSGRQWQDVPGIVYPSLLLSPDGSFDRNGAVSPTVGGSVAVVPGLYGNAWQIGVGVGNYVTVPHSLIGATPMRGTILMRFRLITYSGGNPGNRYLWIIGINTAAGIMARANVGNVALQEIWRQGAEAQITSGQLPITENDNYMACHVWEYQLSRPGVGRRSAPYSVAGITTPEIGWSGTLVTLGNTGPSGGLGMDGLIESVLIYPVALPDAEIARISRLPAAWTMQNAAANIYQPTSQFGLFVPGKKTASGSTTLRNAPGTGSDTIATLSAGTLIEVSQAVRNVSSVDYALVKIQTGESGWIPVSQITDL